jgi:hypothetical protein
MFMVLVLCMSIMQWGFFFGSIMIHALLLCKVESWNICSFLSASLDFGSKNFYYLEVSNLNFSYYAFIVAKNLSKF